MCHTKMAAKNENFHTQSHDELTQQKSARFGYCIYIWQNAGNAWDNVCHTLFWAFSFVCNNSCSSNLRNTRAAKLMTSSLLVKLASSFTQNLVCTHKDKVSHLSWVLPTLPFITKHSPHTINILNCFQVVQLSFNLETLSYCPKQPVSASFYDILILDYISLTLSTLRHNPKLTI